MGEEPPQGTPVGRRIVLGLLALGGLGIVAGRAVSEALDALARRDPTGLAAALPGGVGFRYYSVTGEEPLRTSADYRLVVTGRVTHPATYALADLAALPQRRVVRDFQCVTGWRVPSVAWTGVPLREVVDRAVPDGSARAVTLRSFDGAYTESLTLEQARRDDVLVATGMQGAPLSRAHGGPVRLLVAPMYGYKSLKWLAEVEVTDRVEAGYWEQRGYDVDAWVGRSNGRRDEPV